MKRFSAAVAVCLLVSAPLLALRTEEEWVDLVQLPLAVDRAVEAGAPGPSVAQLVDSLNEGQVLPVDMIEILRFFPAALEKQSDLDLATFVRDQNEKGVRGTALAATIHRRMREVLPAGPKLLNRAVRPFDPDFVFRSVDSKALVGAQLSQKVLEPARGGAATNEEHPLETIATALSGARSEAVRRLGEEKAPEKKPQ